MQRPRFTRLLAALLIVAAVALTMTSLPALSAPVFTGDAAADFSGPAAFKLNDPGGQDVGLPPNAPPGTISGWDMRDVYVEYDSLTDSLYVGFDCYGICGDADGNGDPATAAPWLISNGGQDTANLSSFESFSLLIDTDNDYNGTTGDYDVVVGVSAFGSLANLGAYLFNQTNVSLPSFGYLGVLPNPVTAFASPSASAPDLELTIANFHTLPGFTFLPGDPFAFQVNAFAGSLLDDGVGEDFAPAVRTPVPITFSGILGDTVWNDLNGNGLYEPGNGEFGIAGVELCLTTALGGAPRCTTTDSAGTYEFDALPPGAYVITVSATNFEPGQALSGFTPTYDLDGGLDNHAGHNLGASEVFLDVDFGYTQQGAIGNYVWLDENSDGYQDAGEPGIPNVTVNLYDASGALAATTLTDSQGGYLFVNLAPGNYYVDINEATLPAGMTQSPYNLAGADFGNQDHSSVAIPGGGGLTGYPVTLGPGQENLTADFGYNFNPPADVNNNQGLAAIGDRIWSDSDGDGVQDSEEVGLAGITVQLFTAGSDGLFGTPDDVAGPTDTTDANGYYLFDNLTPGAYVVKVTTPPAGYIQTGDADHFGTSGANNDNQTTTPVLLAPGDVFLNADFGYQPPAAQNNSLGDKVWFDADADGVGPNGNGGAPGNDNTETGIAGVSVALIADLNNNAIWDAGEPIIASDITNATGDYLFTGLPDGSYLVWVNDTASVLSAYTPTYDIDGGAATSGSGAPIGATASATLGLSSALNLGVGSATPVNDLTHDFGYTAANQTPTSGLIGDRVWLDINGDGVQDVNEPGLEGITVILKDNNGNTVGFTTTDENGNYYFGGLEAGTYTVVVTPPAGMTQTYDADGLGTAHESTVSIGPGGINLDQDFGYRGTGVIGDLVWEDLNANGSFDAGEPGFGGVTLAVYWDLNGNSRVDVSEPLAGSASTAADGSYLFSGLPVDDGNGDAQFVVRVTDAAGVLAGYWHSLGAAGLNNNSQTDPYAATLTPGAPSNLTADFGYFVRAAALGNFVWNDLNGNGIQEAGEPGLNNVKVTLTAYYAGGVSYSLTTLTGDDPATAVVEMGWYGFGNLLLDEDTASSTTGAPTPTQPVYTLAAPIGLPGLIPTVVGASGSTSLNDSNSHTGVDGLATQGRTNVQQNADPGTESNPNATYDFGYLPAGAIGNYIWLDENSDGYQDAGEPGIPNVTLSLYDGNGALVATTVTDSQGGYLFSNLTPDTYYVDVNTATLPVGVTQSPYNLTGADFGNQDHSTLSIPGGGGLTGYLIDLTAGQENLTADFGYNYNPPNDVNNNTGTAALGDRVWIDADGNGVQDAAEPGLVGVTVQLFTAGPDDLFGTPDDVAGPTTTTGANGYYLFDNLTPGAYVVKVTTPPAGYIQTGDPDHFGTSGANNDNQTTTPVLLAPGDVFLNVDFGYQPPAAQNNSLGDFVWFDADADGVGPNGNGATPGNDNSELPIPGVTVALIRDANGNGLWDTGESIIATAITAANGYYLFPGLPDGSYLVWVNDTDNVLSDKVATYDADGGTPYNGSGAPIGLASSTTLGLSSVINLGVGSATPVSNLTQDFGYTAPGQTPTSGLIGDRVWLDINGDGVQDANEPGLEGLTVTLKDNNGNTLAVMLTDENGNYAFGGLPAGTYTVVVTPPAGMTQTYDADGLGTANQSTVSIGPGGINLDQDFGYRGTGVIGDLVWEDLNANGSFDAGEPAFGGVTLVLYWDLNGNNRIDSGEPLVGSTTTVANGSYLFSGLPVDDGGGNAQFVVHVTDATGALTGYWHSLGAAGMNNNSQTDPYAAGLTPGAPSNLTADFGYFVKAAALGNFVWNDLDGDGIQDAGEPGLNNVRVTLTARYANGATYSLTTLTGNDPTTPSTELGWYGFGNLLLDEDTASSTTGAPTSTQPVYTLAAPTGPFGLIPTTVGAPGSTPLNDSNSHTGVDGLATQGRTNVQQNANPNAESNPIASYDFGFFPSPAQVAVEKTQISPDPVLVGGEVIYRIRITNTGPTVIDVLPLQDTYDAVYLAYTGATPASDDNINDGVINWSDLTTTFGNLNPGSFVDVMVHFTVVSATNSLIAGAQSSDIQATQNVQSTLDIVIGGINLGELPNYLFFFADGSQDANWQGATKGFVGDVAVDGVQADERTSGGVAFAGTIYSNDSTLSAWGNIVAQNAPPKVNPAQAFGVTGETARITNLEADLLAAFAQINALPATTGYNSVSSTSLNNLNTQDGIAQTFVINITAGLNFSSKINIKGDAGDVFVLRWDTDGNPANGYQGQVKPQSGGAIVPQGGLKASNFINVAGDINSSGGGSNPPAPYPQGPRYNDGTGALIAGAKDFSGGGFFTGYWLTTGNPTNGDTAPQSNGIHVGGWYTISDKFSMTSGTSGVYVSPNPNTLWTKDYGDAPDTGTGTGVGNYNTLATDNGPSHTIIANLSLGNGIPDVDSGTLQNATATADDTVGIDDENGVTLLPTITSASTSVPLSISVYNNTGANATVACWIDFNRDGDFLDAGERAAALVGSSGSQQSVDLTFTGFAAPSEGVSYLRCRVANNGAEVANPTGPANTGEVEDYAIGINGIVVTCDVAAVIGAIDINGGVAPTVTDDACTRIIKPLAYNSQLAQSGNDGAFLVGAYQPGKVAGRVSSRVA